MTGNKRNRTSRRRRGNGKNDQAIGGGITRVAYHNLFTTTLSGVTGITNFTMQPQTSPLAGVAEVADQFDLFRLKSLHYRIHPMDPSYTVNQALVYIPDVDIQTQTVGQASQSPIAAVATAFTGVPSSWVRVPQSQLKGMLDWYKCTADGGAAEFESQGILQAVGGLGNTLNLEIRGVIEFKNPVSNAVMMSRTIARAVRLGLVNYSNPVSQKETPPGKSCESVATANRMGARLTDTKRQDGVAH